MTILTMQIPAELAKSGDIFVALKAVYPQQSESWRGKLALDLIRRESQHHKRAMVGLAAQQVQGVSSHPTAVPSRPMTGGRAKAPRFSGNHKPSVQSAGQAPAATGGATAVGV